MKKKSEFKTISRTVYFSQIEIERLNKKFKESGCQTISQYLREASLQRPVRQLHKDASFERFLDEAVLLREELQAVRECLPSSEPNYEKLIGLEENIKEIINKIFDICTQRSRPVAV